MFIDNNIVYIPAIDRVDKHDNFIFIIRLMTTTLIVMRLALNTAIVYSGVYVFFF